MNPLDESYENLIDPTNFVKNFAADEHFREWAKQGTINDLKETLEVFEASDLFEHCKIIQEEIDNKVDVMLSGLGFDIDD